MSTTQTTPVPSPEPLNHAVAEFEAAEAEIARLSAMLEEKRIEERSLLGGADIGDADGMAALRAVRDMIEIIPIKINRLQKLAASLDLKAKDVARDYCQAIEEYSGSVRKGLFANIESRLADLEFENDFALHRQVARILRHCGIGRMGDRMDTFSDSRGAMWLAMTVSGVSTTPRWPRSFRDERPPPNRNRRPQPAGRKAGEAEPPINPRSDEARIPAIRGPEPPAWRSGAKPAAARRSRPGSLGRVTTAPRPLRRLQGVCTGAHGASGQRPLHPPNPSSGPP
jgi:hypothetical protein